MNWILLGFRGSGKTTLGRALSLPFFDTDEWIEKEANKPISELPMETFLTLEHDAVKIAASKKGTVIAVGGATLLDSENRKILSQVGGFIYICASKNLLKKRWEKRPLRNRNFEAVYSDRIPQYEVMAEATFTPEKEAIEKLWEIINSEDTFALQRGASPTERPSVL